MSKAEGSVQGVASVLALLCPLHERQTCKI